MKMNYLTYQELNKRANRIAHYLRERGVRPDTRVAICAERGLEMMVGLLAILKAGGAYVPLDPTYPPERLRYMLEDSTPTTLLTEESLAGMFAGVRTELEVIELGAETPEWADRPEVNPERRSVGLRPEHLAYVIYTSGSTGMPKGAMNEHRGVVNRLAWMQRAYGLDQQDSVLQKTPFSFDVSVWEFFWPLQVGARLVMARPGGQKDPAYLIETIQREKISTIHFVPSMLQAFLEPLEVGKCSSLERVICSGETLQATLARRFQERLMRAGLHNLYGPTEAAVDVTAGVYRTELSKVSVSIGSPIANTRIYILDEAGRPAPVGVAGEIHIGGVQVGRGYRNRPELTAERFVADPFAGEGGGRMYRTGDLGRWLPDGTIEFAGRNDYQVKVRGFRIELGEIEAQLEKHPGIREGVVVAREESPGDQRLVAYYTGAEMGEDTVGAEVLRMYLAASLPEHMVPAAYVRLESLPLTPNGKLDRKALPAPEADAYAVRGYVAPESEVESVLAEIWSEVLKVERIGRHDNFFELGGHSLLAVTLIERMRRRGLQADVRALFNSPTPAGLAEVVSWDAGRVEVPPNGIPLDCGEIRPEMLPLVDLSMAEIERIVRVVSGGAANVQDIYPLTPLQEGILFHHLMASEGDTYLLSCLYSFDSRERLDRYVSALQAVVDRHDILRTAVVWEGLSEPVQVVWRKASLPVEEVRLEEAKGDPAEQLYRSYDPRQTRIEVSRAPLMRVYLARDEARGRWLMLLLLHHLAGDHTTVEVMQEEIRAHLQGESDRLAAPQPFRNFVGQARMGVSREEHEVYFRRLLGEVEEATAPFGLLEVRGEGRGIEEARLELEEGLSQRVRERARKLGVSAASVFHVAWAQVLGRASGREDVVFGTVLFGRMQGGEGADRVMGLLINTLPVRIGMGEEGAEESVRRTHGQLGELMRHEHASLALAQRGSGVAAPAPLFTALLNYRHSQNLVQTRSVEEESAWEGIEVLRGEERTNYPLALSVDDLGEGFVLTAQVEASIDPRRVCGFMQRAVEGLVEALEREPGKAIRSIDVLPEWERRQVVEEWNRTEAEYPSEECIHELFERQAERTPQAVAVVYEDDCLTYQELNKRANRMAHYLRERGVRPDARVAICAERGLEMMVGLLAILKAGGAYVPLDPTYPPERLRYMLEDSTPTTLLTEESLAGMFAGVRTELEVIKLGAETPEWADRPEVNPERRSVGLRPEHLAYVIYTSGSTGMPKGAMNEHRGVVNRLAWMQRAYGLDQQDSVLQKTPFSFDVSVWEFFWPLQVGARLVMARPGGQKDPAYLIETIQREKISTIHFVPSMLQAFLEPLEVGKCSSLERVICSGETLQATLARRFQERLMRAGLHNLYGPTEAAVDVTAGVYRTELSKVSVSIGSPIANTWIYILDEAGRPAPVGVAGEIHIGGVQVGRGYRNRPELTAERFVADPFAGEGGGRMYRTGDLGRWLPDGTIEFAGRNDYQVKVRGFRIELGEIEAQLEKHPGIREGVVVAREESPGDQRLVAYYTGAQMGEDTVGAEVLRTYLAASLPEHMVPAAYVRLESLPLTPNGKLDRRALPAPESGAYATRSYEQPVGEVERALADIWSEVLKVERIGRHDNFFELGGHSLLAVTLIERMRRRGLQADVRALFNSPTPAGLAEVVSWDAGRVEVPPNGIPLDCGEIRPEMLPLVDLSMAEIERIVRVVSGGAANVQDIYPLTPLQEGILFHHLMASEGDTYLLSCLYSFDSRERLDRYVSALQAVVDRHDILRTAVVWEGLSEPVQVVWRKASLPVEEVRLEEAKGDPAEQLYRSYDPRQTRIEVSRAPLMRVYLARDEARGRWLMLLLLHHLAGDHTTVEVMQEEIRAHLQGENDRLAAPQPFRNFVGQARMGVSREEHEVYFRRLLGEVEEATAPFGLLEVRGEGRGIEEARLELEEGLSQRVRERARKLGVSAASVFHVAWAQVLGRVSGREDVVFGTVLFGRMQGGEGADRVMGLLINTLPVRIGVGEEGAEESVRRTHGQLGELMRHEHASLALAQRCSGVAAPAPLFTALLNYRHSQNLAQTRSVEEERVWEGIEVLRGEERTNYPLTLSVDDLGEEFVLTAQVEAPIDPRRICGFMQRAVEGLVEALEREPGKAIRSIDVLPEWERRQVVEEWNRTEAEYPSEECIHELFERQAERTPQAVAVVYEDDCLTYQELNKRANRMAHYLRERGVRPDARVAICAERGLEMMVGLLAILKAGGAYVPLDPTYPPERLRYMLEDSTPTTLLTEESLAGMFAGVRTELEVIKLGAETPEWADRPEVNPERRSVGLRPEHLAYVIYTSGSTGMPKGAMNEHRGVVNRLAWMQRAYGLDQQDSVLQKTPFSFDVSVWEFFWPLQVGARLVMARPGGQKDPAYLIETIQREKISTIHFVPSMLQAFLEPLEVGKCSSLERVICSGETLQATLARRFQERLMRAGLHNLYGPTEAAVDVTAGVYRTELSKVSVSIGSPIANTRIYILDEAGRPAPVGVAGEIHIGGVQVGRGYRNRPELTAERFVADPFAGEGGGRMYRTGDLGRWLPDGTIEFAGRNDYQVKVRGFRIELGEIEAQLEKHPGIREGVVVAREESPGDQRLVAYYTGAEMGEDTVGAEVLRTYLAASLPEHMVPAAYVRLESLPLTPNGKLDRRALPAPESGAYATRSYEQPVGEVERALADIWSEVLKVERIGRHDNFFELGGHSLLAMQVISRLRDALSVEVPFGDLFAHPVLSDFASGLEIAAHTELPSITPVEGPERLALSFAQQRLWFISQLGRASKAYHIPIGLRLVGDLDRTALRKALDRIVARHEILRTTFGQIDGQPVQRIATEEESRFHLLEHDLRHKADAEGEICHLIGQEALATFDLEQGPLIRGRLIRQEEDVYTLLITMHHIVSDGWSIGVLMGELGVLYDAYRNGEADPLPSLRVQYADYAVWQRGWMGGDILKRQADYWRETLEGAPALLELAPDQERPAEQDYAGSLIKVELEPELTEGLKALSQRHGTTLFMTLLAGWGALLGRLAGQEEVVIGTPVANRGRTEIEGLIGFFVNTLALRLDVLGTRSVGEVLERVKAQVVAAQQHQDIPFEQVVEMVGPVRSLAHSPLFQAMFAWQSASKDVFKLPGLEVAPLGTSPHVTTRFDLTLVLQEAEETVIGGLEYATSLFESSTVERYLGYWRALLRGMVADETEMIGRLPLLSECERRQVVEEWNRTEAEYPSEECIHELFERQAERTPQAVAVVCEGNHLSYGELNARANCLAHHLRERGLGPGGRAVILLERSIELVVAELAILKCGAAYVPIDPSFPRERIRFIVGDSGARIVLTMESMELVEMPATERVNLDEERLIDGVAENLDQPLDSGAMAYIMYTSGSTGQPKGVVIPHRAVARVVINNGYAQFNAEDAVAFAANPAFDATTLEVWAPLLNGGRIVVIEQAVLLEPRRFREMLRRQGVNVLWLTVGLFNQYADELSEDIVNLRYMIIGGDVVDPKVIARVLLSNPPKHLINGYGPTETTTFATTYEISEIRRDERSIPIGRPITNTRIYILNVDGEPAPIGVMGELYIGGAGVALGYLNRPELTAERFVADPFAGEGGGRMYRTGDLGRWLPDGTIEFAGRNDYQVKVRGFRIELGEIEAQLERHPGIREGVVVAREESPGDQRLVAYYTGAEMGEDTVGAEVLRTYLAANLPDYMVPAAYVRLESLPLTPNGKLDRKALPAPEADAYAVRGYVAPKGEMESVLAGIWSEVLKVERIGRHDNFFELGGHSLLTLQLVSSLKRIGICISIADVLMHPTIESLAQQILQQDGGTWDYMAIPIRAGSGSPPLFLIHEGAGLLLYALKLTPYIDADIPIYGLPPKPLAEAQFRTIEGMAARMVRMIRAVQPIGPYFIAGWSFGGTLAYEIATQLIGEDQIVQFLGLFDTNYGYCADAFMPEQALDDKNWLFHRLYLESGSNESLQSRIEELKCLELEVDFGTLVRKCHDMSILPRHIMGFTTEEVAHYLSRERMFYLANLQYIAQPIPIPIYLFTAQCEEIANPLRHWDAVLPTEQIRVIPVPGTHQSMVKPPNIELLGRALSDAIRNASEESQSLKERSYSPLVTLHTERRSDTALFCVPGAGDSVSSFAQLAHSLDKIQLIYGLQPRGLDGVLVPHSTVSAAAKLYLQTVNEIHPQGPVHLLGHSFGGWVVFEMAQRMRAAGRVIASLTILDSEAPDTDDTFVREYNRTEVVMKLIEIYEQVAGCQLEITSSDLESCDAAAQGELIHERLVAIGLLPRRSEPEILGGPLRTFAACLRTHYQPDKVYPELVRLVLLDDPKLDEETNWNQHGQRVAGWRRWAPNLSFWHGPGNHMSALRPPYIQALATWFSLVLQSNVLTEPIEEDCRRICVNAE